MIKSHTDYFSDDEIQDAITMMFGPGYKLNPTLAPELQVQDTGRKVMEMLRSGEFQEQWKAKKLEKCHRQMGIIENEGFTYELPRGSGQADSG